MPDPEDAKAAEQTRDFENKRWLLAAEKLADQLHAEQLAARQRSSEYGAAYIRTMSLLNGGAIVALLTLMGSLLTRSDKAAYAAVLNQALISAHQWFVMGLTAIALVGALGYLNWFYVAQSYLGPAQIHAWLHGRMADPGRQEYVYAMVNVTLCLAVVGGLFSLFSFAKGALRVASVFAKVPL